MQPLVNRYNAAALCMPASRSPRPRKTTAFGEPLWVDALKTAGVGLATLLVMFVIGAALGLMIIAPWGRASPECSMWCVMEERLESMFASDPD